MSKIFKMTKLKIIAVILAVSAIAIAVAGGSLAFFTDTQESMGVFTAGNVYIELSEARVKPDRIGHLVQDTDAERLTGGQINENGATVVHDYGVVFPGQTIYKDPTVKNVGSDKAWVAAKVIIKDGAGDIHPLFSYNDVHDDIDIERLLSGGLLDEHVHVGDWNGYEDVCYNDNYAMIQIANRGTGVYEFYFLMEKPVAPDQSVTVFDGMFIDAMFGNEEMQQFRELTVLVQAFAVQTFGFDSCLDAMIEAFPEHFAASN